MLYFSEILLSCTAKQGRSSLSSIYYSGDRDNLGLNVSQAKKPPHISKITGCQMNSRCVWKEGKIRGTVYRRKTIPALHSCDAANRWSSSAMDTNSIKRAHFSQIDTASKHIKTNHRASYHVKVWRFSLVINPWKTDIIIKQKLDCSCKALPTSSAEE